MSEDGVGGEIESCEADGMVLWGESDFLQSLIARYDGARVWCGLCEEFFECRMGSPVVAMELIPDQVHVHKHTYNGAGQLETASIEYLFVAVCDLHGKVGERR